MEMLLQQSGMVGPQGVAACRPGAMMAAKQERDADDDDEQEAEAEEEEQRRRQAAGADQLELRRGPWTVDEDLTLINYISDHGEGRWNALARAAGLKRTGKSCRLRWLNYLRPDVKRGDFTADEQLLILDLHSRWGNRWSKIAAQLAGRTDNEIKNYWRTRVQKHAKQLNCDVNSKRFKDAMRFLWMPRLAERANAANNAQHHHPSPPSLTTPCMSSMATPAALMTTMQLVDAPSNSNNSGSPSSVVTTAACSGSSCSSLTSDTAHDAAIAAADPVSLTPAADDDDYYWGAATATMQQQQQQQQNDDHYDFWSTASALQHLTADHFQQQAPAAEHELTGWVQGFSDGICLTGSSSSDNNLWSLDDIWRMPTPQGYYT